MRWALGQKYYKNYLASLEKSTIKKNAVIKRGSQKLEKSTVSSELACAVIVGIEDDIIAHTGWGGGEALCLKCLYWLSDIPFLESSWKRNLM